MNFVNLTPHDIVLNSGEVYKSEGIARVSSTHTEVGQGLYAVEYGDINGLPPVADGTRYIVSAIVLAAAKASGRTDCVAPATGHPDCVRNEKGQIVSVPGFVL